MKFTQEDLLNAMGIEIGKKYALITPFGNDVAEAKIAKSSEGGVKVGDAFLDGNLAIYSLSFIISQGVEYSVFTPPKYTLTETEKHIVLAIDEEWKWIARNYDTTLCVFSDTPRQRKQHWLCWEKNGGYYSPLIPLNHHFQFIQWTDTEPVSLDELREIAKK